MYQGIFSGRYYAHLQKRFVKALDDGEYDEAEKILLSGLNATANEVVSMPLTKARIFQGLSGIAEKKGNNKLALNYLKQYFDFYKKAFNEEKINNPKI